VQEETITVLKDFRRLQLVTFRAWQRKRKAGKTLKRSMAKLVKEAFADVNISPTVDGNSDPPYQLGLESHRPAFVKAACS
jgi:hypothetical protein